MNLSKALYLAAIVTLGGCHAGPVEKAKHAVGMNLLDAESARWNDLKEVTSKAPDGSEERYVCGYVNSKNAMGAYSGFRFFGYNLQTDVIVTSPDMSDLSAMERMTADTPEAEIRRAMAKLDEAQERYSLISRVCPGYKVR